MKEYVLDANALTSYFQNREGSETIDKLMMRAHLDEISLSISVINLGEVLYTVAKALGLEKTKEYIRALGQSVEIVAVDQEFALEAAAIKFQYKLGYADSIAALLAMRRQGTLVTADPEFAKLGKRLKVLALPRHSQ